MPRRGPLELTTHYIAKEKDEKLEPKLFLLVSELQHQFCWSLTRQDHKWVQQLWGILHRLPEDLKSDLKNLEEGNEWAECKLEWLRRELTELQKRLTDLKETEDPNFFAAENSEIDDGLRVYTTIFGSGLTEPAAKNRNNSLALAGEGAMTQLRMVKNNSRNRVAALAGLKGLRTFPESLGSLSVSLSETIKAFQLKNATRLKILGFNLIHDARDFWSACNVYLQFAHPLWLTLLAPENLQLSYMDERADLCEDKISCEATSYGLDVLRHLRHHDLDSGYGSSGSESPLPPSPSREMPESADRAASL